MCPLFLKFKRSKPKKMKLSIYKIFFFFLLTLTAFLHIGCECNRVDCAFNLEDFTLNLVFGDQDAVFGENPVVQVEDIRITSEGGSDIPITVFNERLQVIMQNDTIYTLTVGTIDTLALQSTMTFVSKSKCCGDIFEITGFTADGEDICADDCTNLVIDLN